MTHTRARPAPRAPELLRGLGAIAVLVVAVLGVPVALVLLAQALAPVGGWSLADLPQRVTRPDDGSLLLLALIGVGWLAWVSFSASVAVEFVAVVRGLPTPRLPLLGLPQHGARALVAMALVLGSPGSHAMAGTPPPLPASVTAYEAASAAFTPPPGVSTLVHAPAGPTVTVERHDTLWSLAERHLGSGDRFPEIVGSVPLR